MDSSEKLKKAAKRRMGAMGDTQRYVPNEITTKTGPNRGLDSRGNELSRVSARHNQGNTGNRAYTKNYYNPTGTKSTTGYVTPGRSRASYKIPTRKGPLNISRAQSGPREPTPPKAYPTSPTPGSRDTGVWKGKRRPIPENLGKKPQGGVDYSGRGPGKRGVWTDANNRVIATAKSEDSGSRRRGLPRNRGKKYAV